jgi:outer membrane protein assembly factor BamA
MAHRPASVVRANLARVGALVAALAMATAAPAIERLHDQSYPHLEDKIVNQVLILGNNHTHEIVFLREMRLQEGGAFRAHDLWRDRERILDLGIFAHVEVEAVPSADGVLVVVSVFERPRWFITPTIDYDFSDQELTVGYRFRIRNLGGMNRQINSRGRYGARDSFSLTWATPWIGPTKQTLNVGFDLQLPTKEPGELRSNRAAVATTRFLGDYKQTRRGLTGFAAIEVLERDATDPDGPVDQISPVLGAGYFRDTRSLRVDPDRGTFLSVTANVASGWKSADDVNYLRSSGDARFFLSIGRGVRIAGRATAVLSKGVVPDYRRVGVGGGNSIRGQPTNVAEGNNLGRASLELRFPLMSERRFAIPIPLVPRSISNFDLRVDGELFVDSGAAWDDREDLKHTRVYGGAGVGLRVFLPVFEVARIELAFNENGKAAFYFRDGNII